MAPRPNCRINNFLVRPQDTSTDVDRATRVKIIQTPARLQVGYDGVVDVLFLLA